MQPVIDSASYLSDLTSRAFEKDGFSTLCTLLRTGGLADAQWDPYEESRLAFEDFDWMLEMASSQRSGNAQLRIALLMYCQAVEMSAPHEMLYNLVRIIGDEEFMFHPFRHLSRKKKGDPFSSIPPSAKHKFKEISALAKKNGENTLVDLIASFFSDEIRNAFSHSDYILAENSFRWTESGIAKELSYDVVQALINNCFHFYRALLRLHLDWLSSLARARRFHKWPDYQVLELLSDETHGVYGFNVHFSNGTKASFTRTEKGVRPVNLRFLRDGGVSFFVGNFDELEPVWKVDGKPVADFEQLNQEP